MQGEIVLCAVRPAAREGTLAQLRFGYVRSGSFPGVTVLTSPVTGHFELVGIAVGEISHALFEAGLGDCFFEVL